MSKRLLLAAVLLVIALLFETGCTVKSTRTHGEEEVPPEEMVEPAEIEGSRWFPDNLRWLTDDEKNRVIEIALNSPAVLEWRQKEPRYETAIGWIVLEQDPSGTGHYSYSIFEYDVVETGIPTNPEESAVSMDDTKTAQVYPNVTIWFGEPNKWVVSVAVDLEKGKAVFEENYPARR